MTEQTRQERPEDPEMTAAPENELDPSVPAPVEKKKLPLIAKVYGLLCLGSGILTLFMSLFLMVLLWWAIHERPDLIAVGDVTLTIIVSIVSFVVAVVNAGALVFFGGSLLKNRRRNAARWSHVLIAITLVQMVLDVMLDGIGPHLVSPTIQFLILLTMSVTVDPSLRQERQLQRELRDLEDREAAERGMLGREPEGKGYIELNFFNLFWVFVVCCFLGLIIETVYHFAVVVPGEIQDRAGLLFGPFSPIYGFGAVLMTVALNRFYKANPAIIFVVSSVIGGLFEAATAWFMQVGFGAVAWDYSGSTIFGLFPDPVAMIFGGRTSMLFMCMWGLLGLVWIKLCLPWLLRLINLIPWKLRYSFTMLCAALMLVNGIMTLGALDCWFERLSDIPQTTPIEHFYAEHFDNAYMSHRFESMTITPDDSGRIDSSAVAEIAAQDAANAGSAA